MNIIRGVFSKKQTWAVDPSSLLIRRNPVTLLERAQKSFDTFLNWVGYSSDFFKENKIVVCVQDLSYGYSDVSLVNLHGLIKNVLIQKLGSNHQDTNDKRVAAYVKCLLKTEAPKAIFEEASKRLDAIYQITFLYKHGKKVALGTAGLLALATVAALYYHRLPNQNLNAPIPEVALPPTNWDKATQLYSEFINNPSFFPLALGAGSAVALGLCCVIRKMKGCSNTSQNPANQNIVQRAVGSNLDDDERTRLDQQAEDWRERAKAVDFAQFHRSLLGVDPAPADSIQCRPVASQKSIEGQTPPNTQPPVSLPYDPDEVCRRIDQIQFHYIRQGLPS
ncbi:MAG: hypothetical protein RLZZ453_822 [Chlamydiota bacterium]|jgi:hypothetical protein